MRLHHPNYPHERGWRGRRITITHRWRDEKAEAVERPASEQMHRKPASHRLPGEKHQSAGAGETQGPGAVGRLHLQREGERMSVAEAGSPAATGAKNIPLRLSNQKAEEVRMTRS